MVDIKVSQECRNVVRQMQRPLNTRARTLAWLRTEGRRQAEGSKLMRPSLGLVELTQVMSRAFDACNQEGRIPVWLNRDELVRVVTVFLHTEGACHGSVPLLAISNKAFHSQNSTQLFPALNEVSRLVRHEASHACVATIHPAWAVRSSMGLYPTEVSARERVHSQ